MATEQAGVGRLQINVKQMRTSSPTAVRHALHQYRHQSHHHKLLPRIVCIQTNYTKHCTIIIRYNYN